MPNPEAVIVKVTAEHISRGLRHSCGHCPVALALNDATGQSWYVNHSQMCCEETGEELETPIVVSVFMESFDYQRDPKPFEFELIRD